MGNNFYWTVYKNIEKELTDLSNLIHIDDKQIEIYSVKIVELLLRTVCEIESISKTLYSQNNGTKPDDNKLFFDADCIDFLEKKWLLSKKQVYVSAPNFHFTSQENKILTPLKKANKKGTNSSDWQQAYQAVKHNRGTSLSKANLKHLIRAMAALYILNLYYKNDSYLLDKDSKGTNFDSTIGSSFSIKLHISTSVGINYFKNADFDECVYILKPTDETTNALQQEIIKINKKATERANATLFEQLKSELQGMQIISTEEMTEKVESIMSKTKTDNLTQVAKENVQDVAKAMERLKYEAIINIQQY